MSSYAHVVHQLQNRSFHVVERTRRSAKCQKMKTARAKRAKILFSIVKYANLWGFCCRLRRGCLSSLLSRRFHIPGGFQSRTDSIAQAYRTLLTTSNSREMVISGPGMILNHNNQFCMTFHWLSGLLWIYATNDLKGDYQIHKGVCLFFPVLRIGCFRDTSRRAIPQLDQSSRLLRGNYRRRKDAIEKCAAEAIKRGYRVIGIQHGGWCASGPRAQFTFGKYGRSNRCRNGKGGGWANDVYRVVGVYGG